MTNTVYDNKNRFNNTFDLPPSNILRQKTENRFGITRVGTKYWTKIGDVIKLHDNPKYDP